MWMIRLVPSGFQRDGRVLDEVVADRDDQVGPVEAGQHVVARLEADRHQRQVRAVVHRPLAHERDGHRHVQAAGEPSQGARGVPAQHAVAGQDDGSRRRGDEPGRVVQGLLGRLGEVGVSGDQRSQVGRRLEPRGGDVLRQLDVGRAGFGQLGHAERLAHDLGDRAGPLDALVPLRDGPEQPHDVDVLVRLLVDLAEARLAGQGDHRGAVQERVGHARHEVGRPGPERRHGHRRHARSGARGRRP